MSLVCRTNRPEIGVIIEDHNGVDRTSVFKILLYENPTTLTNESLIGHRIGVSRLVNDFQIANIHFQNSRCTPEDGKFLGKQSWWISCHLPYNFSHLETGEFATTVWAAAPRDGHCKYSEICVDALGTSSLGQMANMARCISQKDYMLMERSAPNVRSRPKISLEVKRANMVDPKADEQTTLEVDAFNVRAETIGSFVQNKDVKTLWSCRVTLSRRIRRLRL